MLVSDLLAAFARKGFALTRDELEMVVTLNDKQRFAFDESPGELPGGVDFFAIIDGQREEVSSGDWRAGRGGDENERFTVLDGHRPMSLFGELASFEDERLVADLAFDASDGHST